MIGTYGQSVTGTFPCISHRLTTFSGTFPTISPSLDKLIGLFMARRQANTKPHRIADQSDDAAPTTGRPNCLDHATQIHPRRPTVNWHEYHR